MPKSKMWSLLHGFFFTLIRSLDSITFTKRFSLTCCKIIYKVWVVCLVFGCVTPPKEAWLTPDDETEQPLSNRSTLVAGLLACPQHFYRMPQIVIFLTLNYNIFFGGIKILFLSFLYYADFFVALIGGCS